MLDESCCFRIVESCVQVVKSGFGIEIIAPVAYGVGVGQGAGFGQDIAPGVV